MISFFLLLSIAAGPVLPPVNGGVSLPGQESPWEPGPRSFAAQIYYPVGALERVGEDTGLFLTLHNWGGTGARGTADPQVLVERYNVIAITVDYYQSGAYDPEGAHPYDFGFLQAVDALRALYFVYSALQEQSIPFHKGRIFATGGSGGGNVSLMANKLAPRTFACVVDMCGMAKLNDDIAFNLEGGSTLNANYSRDPASPNYLSPDMQAIRFIGHPAHLKTMRELGHRATIVVVHGKEDDVCPVADAEEMARNMAEAGLRVDTHLIGEEQLDGEAFKSTGHSLGDRTKIVQRVADQYLLLDTAADHAAKMDFDLKDQIAFATPNGAWIIDYSGEWPAARFTPAASLPPANP